MNRKVKSGKKAPKVLFDYSKLRGCIIEKFGAYKAFANALGITPTALSLKLCNKRYFSQDEIWRSRVLLGINPGDMASYFFACGINKT